MLTVCLQKQFILYMDDIYMFVFKFDFLKIYPTKKKELDFLCFNSGKLAWNCQLFLFFLLALLVISKNKSPKNPEFESEWI